MADIAIGSFATPTESEDWGFASAKDVIFSAIQAVLEHRHEGSLERGS
jgi:hypothetical protein